MTDFVIASITDYGKNRGLESDKRQSLCSTSSKGGLMKHISIIFVLLLTGICCSAQEKPKELTFLNTRFVEGASKEELYSRGNKWTHYRDEKDGIYGASGYNSSKPVEYFHIVQECPNFGVSKYFSRYGSAIHFNIKIVCRDGSYTAKISRIEAWLNPDLGILYGEIGMLYENFYNRKQLKMGKQIVAFLFDYTDKMFEEIYGFMSGERK